MKNKFKKLIEKLLIIIDISICHEINSLERIDNAIYCFNGIRNNIIDFCISKKIDIKDLNNLSIYQAIDQNNHFINIKLLNNIFSNLFNYSYYILKDFTNEYYNILNKYYDILTENFHNHVVGC